jgi:hypothetical protein
LHFADSRSLSDREFMEIFGADLAATIGDLRAKDVDKFTADVRLIGEALANGGCRSRKSWSRCICSRKLPPAPFRCFLRSCGRTGTSIGSMPANARR